MKDPVEIALGLGSIAMSASGFILAQGDAASVISDYLPQVGSVGLAVWLVVYHTRVTIPGMQAAHKAERQEDRAAFQLQLGQMQADHKSQLSEERKDHATEMERQRGQFTEMMSRVQCKFREK